MYLKNIPFNYFEIYLSRFLKQKRFGKEINEVTNNYYDFLLKNKIWFIHKLSIEKEKEFRELDRMKINFKIPTIDSLIFFMAKSEKGYFVTNDHHHFLWNKELKKEYKREIKIISPQKALEIMKTLIKK